MLNQINHIIANSHNTGYTTIATIGNGILPQILEYSLFITVLHEKVSFISHFILRESVSETFEYTLQNQAYLDVSSFATQSLRNVYEFDTGLDRNVSNQTFTLFDVKYAALKKATIHSNSIVMYFIIFLIHFYSLEPASYIFLFNGIIN